MKVRGRIWVAAWLLFFLAVSLAVVARQRAALATADRLNRLREERLALEAERAEYERRIREGQSRTVLVPRAEGRLQLHLPADSEYVILRLRPPPDPRY
jgi:hypothetical protein